MQGKQSGNGCQNQMEQNKGREAILQAERWRARADDFLNELEQGNEGDQGEFSNADF